MIQSHVTKKDLTPVKTAAEAKFLVYLSPLSISFECYDVIFMSCVPKCFSSDHNNEDR